jgi:hypothetical protein
VQHLVAHLSLLAPSTVLASLLLHLLKTVYLQLNCTAIFHKQFVHATSQHCLQAKWTRLLQQTSQLAVFTLTTSHLLSTLIHQKSTKLSFTALAVPHVPAQKELSSRW